MNVIGRKTDVMRMNIEFSAFGASHGPQRPVTAETGRTAVDVLFSDVMMPGTMNGVGPANAARRLRPGLPKPDRQGDLADALHAALSVRHAAHG